MLNFIFFVKNATKTRAFTACALFALCSGSLFAAPAVDDIDQFLQEKGLIEKFSNQFGQQIGQVRDNVANKASELVVTAMGYLGVPYQRGGNNFDQGFDCSGFVKAIFQQTAGLVLPRRSVEQAAATQPIEKSDLQPGDLVFFNTLKASFSHVGIYVGDNKFIHSPRSGAVIRVEDMNISYWNSRFNGARRVGAPVSLEVKQSP